LYNIKNAYRFFKTCQVFDFTLNLSKELRRHTQKID